MGYLGCYILKKERKKSGLTRNSRGCLWYVLSFPFHHRWMKESGGSILPPYCLFIYYGSCWFYWTAKYLYSNWLYVGIHYKSTGFLGVFKKCLHTKGVLGNARDAVAKYFLADFWLSKRYFMFYYCSKAMDKYHCFLHYNNWCSYLVNQVLHMDRNDYYGGESTSLNLIQVLLLTCHLRFLEGHNFILVLYILTSNYLFTVLVIFIYSSGRGSGEMRHLQHIWALAGIIT